MKEEIAIVITGMALGAVALLAVLMIISFFNSRLWVYFLYFDITAISLLIFSWGMDYCGERGFFT